MSVKTRCLYLFDTCKFSDAKMDKSSSSEKFFPPLDLNGVTDDLLENKIASSRRVSRSDGGGGGPYVLR